MKTSYRPGDLIVFSGDFLWKNTDVGDTEYVYYDLDHPHHMMIIIEHGPLNTRSGMIEYYLCMGQINGTMLLGWTAYNDIRHV